MTSSFIIRYSSISTLEKSTTISTSHRVRAKKLCGNQRGGCIDQNADEKHGWLYEKHSDVGFHVSGERGGLKPTLRLERWTKKRRALSASYRLQLLFPSGTNT